MRIIIKNESDLSDATALTLVKAVMDLGRVSGDSYCQFSTFGQGHMVYANKTKTGTDTFVITGNTEKDT